MPRLIDADNLFIAFERAAWYNNADRDDIAEELLLNAPTVDAMPVVHGFWITIEKSLGLYVCSKCGHSVIRIESNYCPYCGAKMDERSEFGEAD